MKKIGTLITALVLTTGGLLPHNVFAQIFPSIEIDANKAEELISEYLTGGHFVYGYENDTLYQDERISDYMRASRAKTIRWPGGTAVMTYHWDDLNGIPFKSDTWEPGYKDGYRDSACFMDLDEYIAYCRKVGAEPMVGINSHSGKKYTGPGKGMEGSLDEARRLIQYCKDRNYNVKNWYIGNESYKYYRKQNYIKYADVIDEYAEVLRSVDPDINIIGDWQFGGRYDEVVNLALKSKHINMMEIHEKWGNGYGIPTGGKSFAAWQKESPIYNGKLGNMIDRFQQDMKANNKDVKFAMNEWGLSGHGYTDEPDAFKCGLMCADFLMELFRHKVAMACYWNLNAGGHNTNILDVQEVDSTTNAHNRLNKISPVGNAFILLSTAMGKHLVPFTTGIREIYGFAAVSPDFQELHFYLLNKSDQEKTIQVQLKNFIPHKGIQQFCFEAPGGITERNYIEGDMNMVLPELSFSHFVVKAEQATGIENIQGGNLNTAQTIYNLGGVKVNNCDRGIYVINGKKMLIK